MSKAQRAIRLSVEHGQCLLTGELTRYTVPCLSFKKLKKILVADDVTFDFYHIDKVDTAGLAWMCALLEQANKQKCQLNFIHIPEQLAKLAKLSGVDDFLPIS